MSATRPPRSGTRDVSRDAYVSGWDGNWLSVNWKICENFMQSEELAIEEVCLLQRWFMNVNVRVRVKELRPSPAPVPVKWYSNWTPGGSPLPRWSQKLCSMQMRRCLWCEVSDQSICSEWVSCCCDRKWKKHTEGKLRENDRGTIETPTTVTATTARRQRRSRGDLEVKVKLTKAKEFRDWIGEKETGTTTNTTKRT